MPLKFRYAAKDQVPEEHASLYSEREGAWFLDVDGAVDKTKLDEFRATNVGLNKTVAELQKKFEGIDPETVKTLLAEKAKLEEEKLIKDGEVEKLVEKRTRAILSEAEKRAHAAEQKAAALSAQLLEKEIDRNVVEAGTKLGLRATAIPDIKARARNIFRIVGGAVAAVETDGKTPVFGQDGVTPLTFDEWVTRQVAEAPHLFESSAGGGAPGHGSGGVGKYSAKNPFAKATWNVTEQWKLQKTDPSLAARLKASA